MNLDLYLIVGLYEQISIKRNIKLDKSLVQVSVLYMRTCFSCLISSMLFYVLKKFILQVLETKFSPISNSEIF